MDRRMEGRIEREKRNKQNKMAQQKAEMIHGHSEEVRPEEERGHTIKIYDMRISVMKDSMTNARGGIWTAWMIQPSQDQKIKDLMYRFWSCSVDGVCSSFSSKRCLRAAILVSTSVYTRAQ